MKCEKCGHENTNGSLFCENCGAKLQIEKKCPSCGQVVSDTARFCQYCGAKLAGDDSSTASGISMGDKNIIAGDVYGSKDDYHISGNATFIKNEDASRKVETCSICGKHTIVSEEGYTCPSCGKFVCSSCYIEEYNECLDCRNREVEANKKHFIDYLKSVISGPISDLKMAELLKKGNEYDFIEKEAKTLILQVLAEAGTAKRSSILSKPEKDILSNAEVNFYSKWDKETATAEYSKVFLIYEQHKDSIEVLDVLLPIAVCYDIEKARELCESTKLISPSVFCAKIDIALHDNKPVKAINLIEEAKLSFHDLRIETKQVELLLTCGAVLKVPSHTEHAKELASKLSDGETKIERSLVFKAKALAGIFGTLYFDASFLNDQDLYVGYCLAARTLRVGRNVSSNYGSVQEAVEACPIAGTVCIYPDDYFEDLEINKSISLIALTDNPNQNHGPNKRAVVHIRNNKTVDVSSGVCFDGLVFTHASDDRFNSVAGVENASLLRVHKDVKIENCTITGTAWYGIEIEDGSPIINGCDISETGNSGIMIRNASPQIVDCRISACAGNGIEVQSKSKPYIKNCYVSGCLWPGFDIGGESTGRDENCSSKSNNQTGYWIRTTANPEMLGCVAENNELRGFDIQDNATGKYNNCSSKSNKGSGYWIRGTANPEMLGCVAENNELTGFDIQDNATGKYSDCSSKSNKQTGYWIHGTANPSFRNCIAISNSGHGFRTDSQQKIVVDRCKSDNNGLRGFAYTKGAHFLNHDCSVDGRKEGLFHKNFVEISVFESEGLVDIDICDIES